MIINKLLSKFGINPGSYENSETLTTEWIFVDDDDGM